MRHFEEKLGNGPQRLFCRHPLDVVKTAEVDGAAVAAQSALAAIVEVIVEVTHGEFANGSIDRFAVTQARKIGLGDSSPTAVNPVNSENMIGILDGLQVHDQWREAIHA